MNTSQQRLMRSRHDKLIGGVAGGIGHYLNVDPVIPRIIFVLLGLYGVGLPLYLVLWVIMPREPQAVYPHEPAGTGAAQRSPGNQAFVAGGGPQRVRAHPMTGQTPEPEPSDDADEEIFIHNLDDESSAASKQMQRNWILGAALIGLGVFFVIHAVLPAVAPFIIPALLIGAGIYILYKNKET